MIVEIGHFAVIIALLLSVVGIVAPIIGLKAKKPQWIRVGRQAVTLIFILLTVGMASLIFAFVTRDFSVKYVMFTSNSQLPWFYTVAALWGGHEGSLLLWVWMLSLFCLIAVWAHWRSQPAIMPYLIGIESLLMFGFLYLIIFLSSPFERLIPAATEGQDLNPLLQDPAMVIHPPMLYMGYVGFSIPFAFAMAALFSGRLGDEWIKVTQRWTLFAWISLTSGILMGGYWAYYELGWGGYWGWDPVENASFMPWLTGTAFLHSVMVQEKRKMFKVWNLFLIILTFSLSLIGTFLVRSGVLSSVHSFATDPGRGLYILSFLSFMLVLGFGTLILRSAKLRSHVQMDSIISKESVFLFNNLFFLVAGLTVFLGTLYPLFIETVAGSKVTVGPPYYNAVFMPVALGLVFLMGIGPAIAWRKASVENLRKNFLIPMIVGITILILAVLVGIRNTYALGGIWVCAFVITTIARDFGKISVLWSKRLGKNVFTGFVKGFTTQQRKYAGLITHLGVLVLIIGIIASTIYQSEKVIPMNTGDEFEIGDYVARMVSLREVTGVNWVAQEAEFDIFKDGEFVTQMFPQKRIYNASQTPTTESAIYRTGLSHLFITMPEVTPNGVFIRGVFNPLILLVWTGGIIMGLGVILNIFRSKGKEGA